MDVKLIYHTPNYHKLVETVARVCYQSYHKDDVNSHNFIKAITSKGHISIASVGNMVFEIKKIESKKTLFELLVDLTAMHEITQFVKWSFADSKANPNGKVLVSMNMLTFLDIYNARERFCWAGVLLEQIINEVSQVPYLKWFYDKSTQLDEVPNEYTAKGLPSLYEPIVLDEDYTALKALGLSEYELGIHATLTMNFITDRSASLQFWRHWSGGCELSQRYVERGSAEFRDMVDVDVKQIQFMLETHNESTVDRYQRILEVCETAGIRKGRAKEIARSILPNAITTQLIQSRPYKNWVHLFKLRDTKHAQSEIQEDVIHLKRVLREVGVLCE